MQIAIPRLERAHVFAHLCRLTLVALLVVTPPLSARAGTTKGTQVLWAGTYSAQIIGTVDQPATAMGKTNKLGSIHKLETTTTIKGKLGVSFGLEYALLGEPAGAEASVEIVVILPDPGLLNPANGKRTRRERWRPSPSVLGGTTIVGYQFEKDWEIVPGRWTFQIWQGDRKLGEQSFCILAEEAPPSSEKEAEKKDPCHSAVTA